MATADDFQAECEIEIILLFILGVLGLAATGYGIEGLASFVKDNATAHAVTALLR